MRRAKRTEISQRDYETGLRRIGFVRSDRPDGSGYADGRTVHYSDGTRHLFLPKGRIPNPQGVERALYNAGLSKTEISSVYEKL